MQSINFQDCVRAFLSERGMSVDDPVVWTRAGIGRPHVLNLMDDGAPLLKTVDRIAQGWDVSVVDLLCGPGLGPYLTYGGRPRFADNVRAVMEKRGMGMTVTAEALGVSRQALAGILTRDNPRLEVIARLAEALRCSVRELLA